MNFPVAYYPINPKSPRGPGGFAVVASDKFNTDNEVDTIVRPIPPGDEFVVREVEGFHRQLSNAEVVNIWPEISNSSSEEWNTWFHLNSHNARRMTLSFEKVIAIIGNLDRHDFQVTEPDWHGDILTAPTVTEATSSSKAASKAEQPSLPFHGDFTPSGDLIALWSECLKDLAVAGGRKNTDLAFASASATERAHQFSSMFRATIGSYAQYLRYEGSGDTTLLNNGRIAPSFQIALAQQFYILPDKGAKFLELLAADFVSALDNGWKVDADWGSLRLTRDSNIELLLRPVEFFDDPDFIESEDVE